MKSKGGCDQLQYLVALGLAPNSLCWVTNASEKSREKHVLTPDSMLFTSRLWKSPTRS